jgi:hypothetical protein
MANKRQYTSEGLESLRQSAANMQAKFSPEQRSERARKASLASHAAMTSEAKRERSLKAGAMRKLAMTTKDWQALSKIGASKGGKASAAAATPTQRSERVRLGSCMYNHELRVYDWPKCSRKSAFTEDQWKAYFDGGEFPG